MNLIAFSLLYELLGRAAAFRNVPVHFENPTKLSALLEVPLMVKSAIALLKGAAQGVRSRLVSNLHARTVKLFKMSKYHVMHRLRRAYSVPLLFGIQFGGMVTSFNRLSVARHQGTYWMKAGMARKVRLKLGYEGFV